MAGGGSTAPEVRNLTAHREALAPVFEEIDIPASGDAPLPSAGFGIIANVARVFRVGECLIFIDHQFLVTADQQLVEGLGEIEDDVVVSSIIFAGGAGRLIARACLRNTISVDWLA